ncbi:immunoglobulin-binding protein 1b [Pectinophora gossypiella]|uniref:Immunoglobulin-binding protein 1 n=1 Tax=Pectinophora gossypiella TaxID=13191 RepID=A0A1E1W7M6_PECGO|nr:immunoglobulin-binding protein 1b [Pectinophora gossypiella]
MMSQSDAGQSSDDETMKQVFESGMKLFETIETGKEATNSDPVQMSIKAAISKFEKCTNMVSLSGMFSANESVEEIPTETLQYLLLPALLGTLTLKLVGRQRSDIIQVAEIYFKDFLQRCKDYGITDIEIPQPDPEGKSERPQSEQAKIASMVLSREAKIKRYKAAKELKEKIVTLSKAMKLQHTDEEIKREYFLTLIQSYVNNALDELSSIEQEKPILEYMTKRGEHVPKEKARMPPLKPVIITRDAVQKSIYGLGYPSIPTMTIEEFYDNRVREGLFPGSCTSIQQTTIQSSEADADGEEADKIQKEKLTEADDPEHLARQRNFDEYKDDHRRGWGNRYNRS